MTSQSYKPPKVLFEDAAMTRDVSRSRTSSDPQEVTDIFSSDDPQAVMWVKLGDVAGRHTLRWEWYDPEGLLYQCTEAVSINNDGKARPYITSWHKIAIKDEKAASLPGTWQVKVFLDDKLAANKSFEIKKISPFEGIIGRGPSAKRDPHKFAVVIGIEKYRKIPPVMFAGTDARVMKDFLMNRVGVPESNILFLINDTASKADIEYAVKDKLQGLIKKGDTLYFYYAGHGIPADAAPYLLPYDGDPGSPGITAYSIDALYKDLDRLQAKHIFVFLDSCFSGRMGRDEKERMLLASARPGLLKVKDPLLLSNKIVVLSSGRMSQLSNSYREQGHGLFTYYLLRGMLGDADESGDGKIQINELARYVEQEVSSASRRLFGISRQQNPVVMPQLTAAKENIEVVRVVK